MPISNILSTYLWSIDPDFQVCSLTPSRTLFEHHICHHYPNTDSVLSRRLQLCINCSAISHLTSLKIECHGSLGIHLVNLSYTFFYWNSCIALYLSSQRRRNIQRKQALQHCDTGHFSQQFSTPAHSWLEEVCLRDERMCRDSSIPTHLPEETNVLYPSPCSCYYFWSFLSVVFTGQ